MVLLNRSTWSFVCAWYTVVVKCLTQGSAHTVAKNRLTNGVPLLVNTYVGIVASCGI